MPTLRSILPIIHGRRVCVPWWYMAGYGAYAIIGAWLAVRVTHMEFYITVESLWALLITVIAGALIYTVFSALSKYSAQKRDAEELRGQIAKSGRDPQDTSKLTPAERWEIAKVEKFDRLFIIADVCAVIIGACVAFGVVYGFLYTYIPDVWTYYAFVGFFFGMAGAWFVNQTMLKTVVAGKWDEKVTEFFQNLRETVDTDEVKRKLIEAGIPPEKAEILSKTL